MGNTNGLGGMTIRYKGGISKGLDKVGDKVNVPRTNTVGQTGECDEAGFSRGLHPDSSDMDYDGANS